MGSQVAMDCTSSSFVVSLISRFVVWHVEVLHAHLEICLLHKSLAFFCAVDVEKKVGEREKVLFKHSQLLSAATYMQSSLYTSEN